MAFAWFVRSPQVTDQRAPLRPQGSPFRWLNCAPDGSSLSSSFGLAKLDRVMVRPDWSLSAASRRPPRGDTADGHVFGVAAVPEIGSEKGGRHRGVMSGQCGPDHETHGRHPVVLQRPEPAGDYSTRLVEGVLGGGGRNKRHVRWKLIQEATPRPADHAPTLRCRWLR